MLELNIGLYTISLKSFIQCDYCL